MFPWLQRTVKTFGFFKPKIRRHLQTLNCRERRRSRLRPNQNSERWVMGRYASRVPARGVCRPGFPKISTALRHLSVSTFRKASQPSCPGCGLADSRGRGCWAGLRGRPAQVHVPRSAIEGSGSQSHTQHSWGPKPGPGCWAGPPAP